MILSLGIHQIFVKFKILLPLKCARRWPSKRIRDHNIFVWKSYSSNSAKEPFHYFFLFWFQTSNLANLCIGVAWGSSIYVPSALQLLTDTFWTHMIIFCSWYSNFHAKNTIGGKDDQPCLISHHARVSSSPRRCSGISCWSCPHVQVVRCKF